MPSLKMAPQNLHCTSKRISSSPPRDKLGLAVPFPPAVLKAEDNSIRKALKEKRVPLASPAQCSFVLCWGNRVTLRPLRGLR